MVILFSRTGGYTGARDCFTCRNERRRVCLGFPLCISPAEGVDIHLESSLSAPLEEKKAPLSHPPPPLYGKGRRKWNSLITNPSLWTKIICINPGAIESSHKTHNRIAPLPQPQHPHFNFEVKSSSLSLLLSHIHTHTHRHSLFSSPRMPCRFVWLGTFPPPPLLVSPSLSPLGWCW